MGQAWAEISVTPVTLQGSHNSPPGSAQRTVQHGGPAQARAWQYMPFAHKAPATLCVCTHSHCDKLSQAPCNTPPLLPTPFPYRGDCMATAHYLSASHTRQMPRAQLDSVYHVFMHGSHPLCQRETRNRAQAAACALGCPPLWQLQSPPNPSCPPTRSLCCC